MQWCSYGDYILQSFYQKIPHWKEYTPQTSIGALSEWIMRGWSHHHQPSLRLLQAAYTALETTGAPHQGTAALRITIIEPYLSNAGLQLYPPLSLSNSTPWYYPTSTIQHSERTSSEITIWGLNDDTTLANFFQHKQTMYFIIVRHNTISRYSLAWSMHCLLGATVTERFPRP